MAVLRFAGDEHAEQLTSLAARFLNADGVAAGDFHEDAFADAGFDHAVGHVEVEHVVDIAAVRLAIADKPEADDQAEET